MGRTVEPRQVNSTLRLMPSSEAPALACASLYEWSRVRVSSAPSRTTYRRESPQCTQCSSPDCTSPATSVVRGVSSKPRSLA